MSYVNSQMCHAPIFLLTCRMFSSSRALSQPSLSTSQIWSFQVLSLTCLRSFHSFDNISVYCSPAVIWNDALDVDMLYSSMKLRILSNCIVIVINHYRLSYFSWILIKLFQPNCFLCSSRQGYIFCFCCGQSNTWLVFTLPCDSCTTNLEQVTSRRLTVRGVTSIRVSNDCFGSISVEQQSIVCG